MVLGDGRIDFGSRKEGWVGKSCHIMKPEVGLVDIYKAFPILLRLHMNASKIIYLNCE